MTPQRPSATPQRPPATPKRPPAQQRPSAAEQKTEVFNAARPDTPTEAFRPAPTKGGQPKSGQAAPGRSKARTPEPAFGEPVSSPQARTEVFRKVEPGDAGGPGAPVRSDPGPQAAAPPPKRRRRKGLIIALVVLIVVLVGGDRLAAKFAGGEVVKQIQASEQLPTKPKAKFGGIPFLTQPVLGKYKDLGISIDRIQVSNVCVDEVSAHLKGLHVSLAQGISGKIKSPPVDHVAVSARISYPHLDAALSSLSLGGVKLHVAAGKNGAAKWSAGEIATPIGLAQPDVEVQLGVQDEALTVKIVGLSVNGITVPQGLLNAVPAVPVPLPLSGLPFNPHLTKATTGPNGVEVAGGADHVKLPAPSANSSSKGQPVKGC